MTTIGRAARRTGQPGVDRVAPEVYFAAVHDTFRRAGQTVGGFVDRFYLIGGYPIRLRFAGPALMPRITPALEHLEVPVLPTELALTVCLWDSASTAATPPPPVGEASNLGRGGEVPG